MSALFIARRFIPHDGTRRAIADGHVKRQGDTGARPDDDQMIADLAAALRKTEEASAVRDAGLEAWHARPQRGGQP